MSESDCFQSGPDCLCTGHHLGNRSSNGKICEMKDETHEISETGVVPKGCKFRVCKPDGCTADFAGGAAGRMKGWHLLLVTVVAAKNQRGHDQADATTCEQRR